MADLTRIQAVDSTVKSAKSVGSSYYAEVPDKIKYQKNYEIFSEIWGISKNKNDNLSFPKVVIPSNTKQGDTINEKAF